MRGSVSLHPRGDDQDREAGKATMEHPQEIVHGGARGAGHDGDASRQERQLPLPGRIEKTLRLESRPELLEGHLQRAGAERLQGIADDLVPPLRLVEREPASDEHRETVLHCEAQSPRLAGEEHRVDAGVRIFQREVEVSARRTAQVRHFSLHLEIAEPAFQDPLHLPGQLPYGVDALRGSSRLGLAGLRREQVDLTRRRGRRFRLVLLMWAGR